MASFKYTHIVGFEETNFVGNVYYANHIRWQGRCRELFLRDHAPDILRQIERGLCLVTARCSCEYLVELTALDEVVVEMRLSDLGQSRLTMKFDYWRKTSTGEELVARGEQLIVCMFREGRKLVPAPLPGPLVEALKPYIESHVD